MSMWLYDEMKEMEDFMLYQKEVRLLEREYLEIRILLLELANDVLGVERAIGCNLLGDDPGQIYCAGGAACSLQ